MAASVPVAGASGHRSLAPISSPATKPPCPLLLHSLQNQAAASECSSSIAMGRGKRGSEGRGGAGGEAGEEGGGKRGEEGSRAARWHPKEEHVCSWLAAWGRRLIPCMRVLTHTHTRTCTRSHKQGTIVHKARQRKVTAIQPFL